MLSNPQGLNKESQSWNKQTPTQHLKILLESDRASFVLSVKTHIILKNKIRRLMKKKEMDTAWREK